MSNFIHPTATVDSRAYIGDDTKVWMGRLERADRAGHKAVVVKRFPGERRFECLPNFWKKHDGGDAKCVGLARLANEARQGPASDAGHGNNRRVLRILVKKHR